MRFEKACIFITLLLLINLIYGSEKRLTELTTTTASLIETDKTEKIQLTEEEVRILIQLNHDFTRHLTKLEIADANENNRIQEYYCHNCHQFQNKLLTWDDMNSITMKNLMFFERLVNNKKRMCGKCLLKYGLAEDWEKVKFNNVQVSQFATDQYRPGILNFLLQLGSQVTFLALAITMFLDQDEKTWNWVTIYDSNGESFVERQINFLEMILRLAIGAYSDRTLVVMLAQVIYRNVGSWTKLTLPEKGTIFQTLTAIFLGYIYWGCGDKQTALPLYVAFSILKQMPIWLNGNFPLEIDNEEILRIMYGCPMMYLKPLADENINNVLTYNGGVNIRAITNIFYIIYWTGNLALAVQIFYAFILGQDVGLRGDAKSAFCIGNLALWFTNAVSEFYNASVKTSYPFATLSIFELVGFLGYAATLNTMSENNKVALCIISIFWGMYMLAMKTRCSTSLEKIEKWINRTKTIDEHFKYYNRKKSELLSSKEELEKYGFANEYKTMVNKMEEGYATNQKKHKFADEHLETIEKLDKTDTNKNK